MAFIATLPIYTVSSLIGKEVIAQMIKETANTAYGAMYQFIDHPEINRALKELDTKAVLKKTETIIKNINCHDINETIHILLNQLHQIICEIIDDLSKINYSLSKYKKKWFKFARRADYKPYLEKLKIDHVLLDKRLKGLFEILNVSHFFDNNNNKHRFIDNIML
tara:strand:- start:816 stop:1310 length:495 start_codon:yes stop_codon:yes gene_type:complete